MVSLQGQNVKLRAIEPEDLECIFAWENDTEIWLVSNTLSPFSRFTIKKYIENSHLDIFQAGQLRLMIEGLSLKNKHNYLTIGTIDIFDFDANNQRAGIGILIGNKDYRGKGYASEAINILISYSFSTLNLHQLYCNIAENNKNSLSLFEKHGFQITGKKKEWIRTPKGWMDEYTLQLLKNSK